ncbi:MAG: hypothetical protein DRP16_03600 [Candidatus Aenigmatarchaeota archaeon]|nr:MAG: hypothetical protein DRP16_03600 [Candidatus Aenigmarchaeota archaeon]
MKNQTKLWVTVGIVVAIVIALIAVFPVQKQEEEVIKVVFIGPLTGNLAAPIGVPHSRGLILGVEDLKESEVNIDILCEDDQSDKKAALTIARQLTETDKNVKILVSPLSGVSFALAPIAKEKDIILFSTGANPEIAKINNNTFRFFIDTDQEAVVMAEYAKNNLKLNTVAILYQNDEFGISERDAIKREFEKRGIDIIQEEAYEIGANDVRSQVTKIISKKPDAIIFTGFGSGLVTAIKTVREFNFEGILFSDLNAAYPPLSTDLVNLTEGMYITDFKFDRNDPKIKKFISEFHNEFGNIRVYPNSALEYSAAQIIGQLIKKCGSNINCMKKEVYLSEFDTVLGNVVFDKDGNAIAPVILKQIVNGQEVIVK